MLQTIDWLIIFGFIVLIVGVGVSYTQKAGGSLTSYFLGGRNLPWYMAGISMVATTFAADTPLAVTELVGNNGISGNWLWWNLLAGGMLTTFFFANMWRRANVVTEIEFIEIRYSGKPAAFLRGFRSVYLGLFMNVLIIGWVNLAMITILEGFFGISSEQAFIYTGIGMMLVAVYSSLSGLLGVVVTDIIQFFIAIAGSILLAIFVLNSDDVGGVTNLKASLPEGTLDFFPSVSSEAASTGETLAITGASFLAFFGFVWWMSWYPGAEPGGGGYIAQRMMSTKNEKHAVYATLFFQIAHYCLRPWPWILVGLSAITLFSLPSNNFPDELQSKVGVMSESFSVEENVFYINEEEFKSWGKDHQDLVSQISPIRAEIKNWAAESERNQQALVYKVDKRYGYVYAMKNYLPPGVMGLLLVSFFAAYMSTISTQLNWGASYLVNDLYYRFFDPEASQKTLVSVSRVMTIILSIIGLIVSLFITSISGVWQFIMECGAGLGIVLILRWYWWRINAWTEIAATLAPFLAYALSKFVFEIDFPYSFFITIGFTTIVWIVVMYTTTPTDEDTLKSFYSRIQPDGVWAPIKNMLDLPEKKSNIFNLTICWISAVIMTYGILFSLGKLLLLEWSEGMWSVGVTIISFIILRIFLKKTRIFA